MLSAIAASDTTPVSSLRRAPKSDFCPHSRAGMLSTELSVERRPQARPKRQRQNHSRTRRLQAQRYPENGR